MSKRLTRHTVPRLNSTKTCGNVRYDSTLIEGVTENRTGPPSARKVSTCCYIKEELSYDVSVLN